MSRLDRDQLVSLVKRIQSTSACVVDLDALLNEFEASIRNPDAVQWIFDPPDGRDLTAEEIVDRALAS